MALSYIMGGLQTAGSIYSAIRERKATKEQHNRTKELMDKSHGLQYDMWKKTNYGAQRQEMEEAGLNPGLMYGSAGAGGQAVAPSAPQGGKENIFDLGSQIASVRMTEAQTKLAEAQAKKTDVEAENLAGVERDVKQAQTGNLQADTRLKEIQQQADNLGLEFQDRTLDSRVQAIFSQGDKLLQEAQQLRNQTNISNATWQEEVKQIKQKTIQAMLDAEATKAGTDLDKAKIKEVAANITYMAEATRLTGEGQVIARENMDKLTKAMLWSAGINATGQIINNVIDIATRPVKAGTEIIETVTKGKSGGVKKVNTTTKTQHK